MEPGTALYLFVQQSLQYSRALTPNYQLVRSSCGIYCRRVWACTVPVPSDEDRHDDAAVAQDGEQDDDGEVDDAALLALLHPGRSPAQLSVRERPIEKGITRDREYTATPLRQSFGSFRTWSA